MKEHSPARLLLGLVKTASGREASHAEITVWWQRIRDRVRLAEGRASEEGRYELTYKVPEDAPDKVLIVVEARGGGLEQPLISSLRASVAKLTIDLTEPPLDASLYATLVSALEPLLGGLDLSALVEDADHQDLSFLSNETGRSREEIMRVCVAERLEQAYEIPAPAFYAFLALRTPSSLPLSLLDASDDFSLIDALVAQIGQLIANQEAVSQAAVLANAVAQNILGPQFTAQSAKIVQELQALRHTQILSSPYQTGKTTLGQLLNASGLAAEKQAAFAQLLADNLESPSKFWGSIGDGTPGFTAKEVAAVRQTLSIGALVKNSLAVIQQLNQKFNAGALTALPQLATLSVQDWEDVIAAGGAGAVPENLTGVAGASPASVFAQETYDRVTRAYPTAALFSRAGRDSLVPPEQQPAVESFFAANPNLDLRRENIEIYLKNAGEAAFNGVPADQRATLVSNVHGFQRLLRIAPHVDTAVRLLKLGFSSATSIANVGKLQFVDQLVSAGASRIDAFKTFYIAQQRYAGVVSLLSQFRSDMLGVWPAAIGSLQAYNDGESRAADGSPTLQTLFGSQDYCEVDFCTSLLSPAAYLTDLLMWLSQRKAGIASPYKSALDVLFARRGDLGTLLLNCPNTDTPLPYIDLVNELLEDLVSAPQAGIVRQTELTADVLRAAPDPRCINTNAYAVLRTAKFPHTLPYDGPLDQLRTVLAQSNLPLWQVRQGFLPLHGAVPAAQAQAVAAVRFQISYGERLLIATPDSTLGTQAILWNTANPAVDLLSVDQFIGAADLTYDQLLQLLAVVWTRNAGAPITIVDTSGTCDTSAQTLSHLDLGQLDRMHRFLRLWRRTGWKMWELDIVLGSSAVSDSSLSGQTLVDLFAFQQLRDATRLTVDQLLTFFPPRLLDNATYLDPGGVQTTSLYSGLFENQAASPDPALAFGNLNGAADLSSHATAIQAALQISAADAATLIGLTDNTRTLANVSQVYLIATLARVTGLALTDARAICPNPTLANPFTDVLQSASSLLAYLKRAAAISQSGLKVDALTYVLTSATAKMQLSDAQVATILGGVRTAMQKVHDGIHATTSPAYVVLKNQLSQLPPSNDPANPGLSDAKQLAQAMSIVDGSFTGGDPARSNFLTHQFGPLMTAQQLADAIANLQPNPALPAGTPYPQGPTLDARTTFILGPLEQYLMQTQVISAVAGSLSLATDVTAKLLSNLTVPAAPAVTETLLTALTDASIIAPGAGGFGYAQTLTAVNFPGQFASLRLMHKESVIVGKLNLSLVELTWLMSNAAAYGGVDLTSLPVLAAQTSQSIDSFLATVLLVQLNRGFNALANSTVTPPPQYPTLMSIVSAAAAGTFAGNDAGAQAALAGVAGASAIDVEALAQALGMTVAAGDYTKPTSYDRMRRLLVMASTASGSGTALVSWSLEPGGVGDLSSAAASAQQALQSRFSPSAWLSAAQAFNDPLRQDRRDALVAYLISQRAAGKPMAWGADSDSLFAYLLIDVEMSACQVTTRVIQAYAAVQLFVQRCLMNLETAVSIDTNNHDDEWDQWSWRKPYRLWEANRKVFLYPENWLIEAQRPNKSEIFAKFEQQAHQQADTAGNLETAVLTYIDALDHIAHLRVTGTCEDPVAGTIHAVARTHSDPPLYYHRVFDKALQKWTPWTQIPLEIKAHHVVPAVYRRGFYLFWAQVSVANEPQQLVPAAAPTSSPQMSTAAARHVEIGVAFSVWRNGSWSSPQWAAGKLFDVPLLLLESQKNASARAVEALYTLKVQLPATGTADMMVDVYRFGDYTFFIDMIESLQHLEQSEIAALQQLEQADKQLAYNQLMSGNFFGSIFTSEAAANVNSEIYQQLALFRSLIFQKLASINDADEDNSATLIGRAIFDGRFSALQMRDQSVILNGEVIGSYLSYAQAFYGHDAEPLTDLAGAPAWNLTGEPSLVPKAGALATVPIGPGQSTQIPLRLALPPGHGTETLLQRAQAPFRIIGPATDPQFDSTNYFFYTDSRRSYFVEGTRYYQYGSQWRPVPPSNPANAPYQVRYTFNPFYHPYTKLFWHEIFNADLPGIYNTKLQTDPASVDLAHTDNFSFKATYGPVSPIVSWGPDSDIVDFSTSGAYSSYNWELFFHIPLYVAQRLSQNQQFEDAMAWFHYIFNPTLAGTDPQRFWITAPLNSLNSAAVIASRINNLLVLINQNDPNALGQVVAWQNNPFNPFLLADMRPVAYMKQVVMAYLDNLIAWGDYLFSSDSRENLNQATLLYVLAAEILGPRPIEVPPPPHADDSFNTLQPSLDAFANAMVDVENLIPASNGASGGAGAGGGVPAPHTFYFRIPPNDKLLNYWDDLAQRLFRLRNCEDLSGQALTLPLFDAPIDPGLLTAAQAAGVDLSSVLNDLTAPMPHYRYVYTYSQSQDFCNAVRAYGAQLLAALEKKDAAALALLVGSLQQQLLQDASQIYQAKVDQANQKIAALAQSLALQQSRKGYYGSKSFTNEWEDVALGLQGGMIALFGTVAVLKGVASLSHLIPQFVLGAAGFGGSPTANAGEGGANVGHSAHNAADAGKAVAQAIDRAAKLSETVGKFAQRKDDWGQKATEAGIEINRIAQEQLSAQAALAIALMEQSNHQTAIDNLQQQLDFLTTKFTSEDLYDWMAGQLSATYFQSYRLAYAMAKRAERCYRYELGIDTSSFVQFGYWDSLHQGLLAGESLAHDLRRLQSSYLELNLRRNEISRIYSLAKIDGAALLTLITSGVCFFSLEESLFDADYPGQYQRQIVRASITVVYASPGKNDNVSCTLTLAGNKVRMNTELNANPDPYAEVPPPAGMPPNDPRFHYQYAGTQSIVMSQAQDDPALFENNVHYQITDSRYLPFEGAGAISDWKLELPSANEIDITTVSDVQIHLLFTSLNGDGAFVQAAKQSLAANAPTSGTKVFSAANDFPVSSTAPAGTLSPWQSFFATPGGTDQVLTLPISASKFPSWTRGKKINVNALTVYAASWSGGSFTLEPQAALPIADVALNPVAVPPPLPEIISSGVVAGAAGAALGNWSFKLKAQGAPDYQSLKSSQIGDLILQIDFSV